MVSKKRMSKRECPTTSVQRRATRTKKNKENLPMQLNGPQTISQVNKSRTSLVVYTRMAYQWQCRQYTSQCICYMSHYSSNYSTHGAHPTQPAYSLMRFLFIWRSLANDEDRPQGRLASRTFGRTAFSGADKLIHYRKLWKIKFENNLPFLLFAGKPQMAFRCLPLPLNRLLSSVEFSGMLAVS